MESFDSPLVSSFIHIKSARAVCVYTHTHIYTHIHSTYAHSESPRKKRALFVSLSSLSLFSSLCVLCVVHRYEEVHIFKVFAKLFVH